MIKYNKIVYIFIEKLDIILVMSITKLVDIYYYL